MSVAQIEKFYSTTANDLQLVGKMLEGTKGPEDFVRNAVKEGKAQGYDFTYEEADAWIKQQQTVKASGELSDSQLEAVAGGKGAPKLPEPPKFGVPDLPSPLPKGGPKVPLPCFPQPWNPGNFFGSW